jgi:hypothetical protein
MTPTLARCRRGRLGLAALIGAAFLGFGCGSDPGVAALSHHPVKGSVILPDGKPLTSGRVAFISTKGQEFFGEIQPDGTFTMKTPAADGLPEGNYVVRLDAEASASSGSKGKAPARKGTANIPYPMKYTDETTSGLTATVKPGDNTLEPFKLTTGQANSKSRGDKSSDDARD